MTDVVPARLQTPSGTRARGRGGHRGRYRGQRSRTQPVAANDDTSHMPSRARGSNRRGNANRSAATLTTATDHASLQARLTHELRNNLCECSICMANVSASQPIYSCPTCSAITHLKCIEQWAQRSLSDARERAQLRAANASQSGVQIQWRCPSCNASFEEDAAPTEYRCFCQRVANPKLRPKQSGILPHSCGEPCQKPRVIGCSHQCPNVCHPGPCDPCLVLVKTSCYCGKDEKTFQCSAINNSREDETSVKTCGQTCGKTLNCGLHQCIETCHAGSCSPCTLLREKRCYCGLSTVQESCCTKEHSPLDRQNCFSAQKAHWTGEFRCAEKCPWMYDCNQHPCQLEDGACHPHTSFQLLHCPYSPDVVKMCPCGKSPLAIQRTQCLDPIPTCSKLCTKTLICGHLCQASCHTGQCPPCSEIITSVCRCGNEKRSLSCAALQDETKEFTCHRQCKAVRHCGRHPCGRICCPLSFQETLLIKKSKKTKPSFENALLEDPTGVHVCPLICNRLLTCGIHYCQLNDHRGACGRCLASEFDEVSCACGGTVLLPPVPCGTKIKCELPCHRGSPPCGHPKIPHSCHEDDVPCPPCSFLIERQCQCDKKLPVKNVRCAQEKVSCGTLCGRILSCGAHRCRLICHKPGECENCNQTCGKPRKYCGHPHEALCHAPSACSISVPCQVMTDVTCACGNNKQRMLCGSSSSKPASSAATVLPCNETCAVLKRNAALADALGINPDRAAVSKQVTVEYEESTLDFYHSHQKWCDEMEKTLQDFLLSTRQTQLFQPMKQPQRRFIKDIAALWNLRAESLDAEPNRAVYVSKKSLSPGYRPMNSVRDAYRVFVEPKFVQRGDVDKAEDANRAHQNGMISADEASSGHTTPSWNALLFSLFGTDRETLEAFLLPMMEGAPFNIDWVKEEEILLRLPDCASNEQKLVQIQNGLLEKNTQVTLQGTPEIVHVTPKGEIKRKNAWTTTKRSLGGRPSQMRAAQPTNRWQLLTSAASAQSSPSQQTPENWDEDA